jgi:uncharacterized phiE125 gp8 family phage protein
MLYALKPVRMVAPAVTPVSLEEAKGHVRVTHNDEDGDIQAYLDAAVAYLDGWGGILGRCMVTQTWRQDMATFPSMIRLPFPDAQSATVAYTDPDGATQAFTDFHLAVDALGSALILEDGASWPDVAVRPDAVRVTGVYGYGLAADVPDSLKMAIKLLVGHWYANREAVVIGGAPADVPLAFDALIAASRWLSV